MPWQRLRAQVDQGRLADVESVLELAGALSITLADAEDQPILEPLPGTTPLWDQLHLEALFEASADLERLRCLLSPLGVRQISMDTMADQDWVAQTEALNQPIRFGHRLRVTPPNHAGLAEDAVDVILTPGLAFGSGLHPTTALCLEWLDQHPPSGLRVLDYGCGSGILGLAALKLGASHAWLVDIDTQALVSSAQNAAQNALQDRTWIGAPEQLDELQFDILLANILANPLTALAARFAELVLPGGDLLLTGLLAQQEAALLDAYAANFEDFSRYRRDGWLCLHGKRSRSS